MHSARETVACELCGRDDASPLHQKHGFQLVRCGGCHLVFVSPRPTAQALAEIYRSDSFTHHQLDHAEDARARREAVARLELLERYRPERGRLLDVGCSAGAFLAIARERGWEVAGLDINPAAVEVVRRRLACSAWVGTLDDVDQPAGFDAITLLDSLEHMPHPVAALAKVRRLLHPGGVVLVTTPNIDGWLPRVTYQLFARTIGAWEHPGPPAHIYQFSRRTLHAALERAGFEVGYTRTEAIPLAHSVGALEEEIIGALRGRKPDPAPSATPSALPAARPPTPRTSLARRLVRAGCWALSGAIAAPAPLAGGGDSLLVIAR